MIKTISFEQYFKRAPDIREMHYWDLPQYLCLGFSKVAARRLGIKRPSITVKNLVSRFGVSSKAEKEIRFVYLHLSLGRKLNIQFPINLNNISYVQLYSLMVAEGSWKSEFRLHVPELIFHDLFKNCLINLFGKRISGLITRKYQKGILRSTAPAVMRYFFPFSKHLPKLILGNKEYCRKYLQIAFEAEGSPILSGSKRYISLKRNGDISNILKDKTTYLVGKRVYAKQFEADHPLLAQIVKAHPPELLLGEHLVLKNKFGIDNSISLEAIQVNKLSFRCGKISARWALYIYADSVNRFINEIGFISGKKRKKTQRMMKMKSRRRQYFVLDLLKKLQRNKTVYRLEFIREMSKLGYVSPEAYIWRYVKKGLIKRAGRGVYKLLVD